MSAIKPNLLLSLIFIFGLGPASGQTRPQAEKAEPAAPKFEVKAEALTGKKAERILKEAKRREEIGVKFTAEDRKCKGLIRNQMLKEAEPTCKAALQLALQLEADSRYQRMGASEAVGHVMFGQSRYPEALEYYSRALDFGLPELTEEDATLGRLYGNLAIAQHRLGNLDKALALYRKSTQIYHRAYTDYDDSGDTVESNTMVKQHYLNSLKMLLEQRRIAAEDAGATSEIKEIEKLQKSLP